MQKLLYVDVPFEGIPGGDKNRSRFLWKHLQEKFDCDLLLLRSYEFFTQPVPTHRGNGQIFILGTQPHDIFHSESIYGFSTSQRTKFIEILEKGCYEFVFFRFCAPAELADIALQTLPSCQIAIDVDMLFSRIAALTWEQTPDLRHRYYFWEKWKLQMFERRFFQKPYLFYFSNFEERDYVLHEYRPRDPEGRFEILPNMMQDLPACKTVSSAPNPYILFFGTLNSAANQDAFLYMAKDIYPRIAKQLQERNIDIYIAGKNQMAMHAEYGGGRLKVIGPVDNLNCVIENSLFVILPLRVASGTRTRILEAAALRKAVLTTTIGAEGFEFTDQELVRADTPELFASKILEMLSRPEWLGKLGNQLYEKSRSLYSEDVVAEKMITHMLGQAQEEAVHSRLRIAIVTNRYYPEVGGAETNIYFQTKMLSQTHEVTVICPRRIDKPRYECMDGIHVYRLYDMMNVPPTIPNLRNKTLCPEVFWLVLKENFDIIQCFPAINYNNMLAFFAAKLSRKPIILCCFDFLDYAGIMQQRGSIDPHILKQYRPNAKEKFFLRYFDHIFAISELEMALFRKYNNHVEYSPVPVSMEETAIEVASPRNRYGIADGEFVFLSLGRISQVKGQDLALEAFSRVYHHIPDSRLVFVGRKDYEPELIAKMEAMIQKEPALQTRVIFTGMVDRQEVLGWLRTSDIHVIPVRFMNSGAVVVESWINLTPVLQSDVVDPNLVVEDHNGYLFKSEDVGDLAKGMLKAYEHRDDFPALAENGLSLVRSKYTYEYLIRLYEFAYRRLLN